LEKVFKIREIQIFWEEINRRLPAEEECAYRLAGMQGWVKTNQKIPVYADLIKLFLAYYDDEPLTPSMAGNRSVVIPRSSVFSLKTLLLSVPLYEHILLCGRIYLGQAEKIMTTTKNWGLSCVWAILVCVIAHDLGKLRRLRPKPPEKYRTERHPDYAAWEMGIVIDPKYGKVKQTLINAVLSHHGVLNKDLEKKGNYMALAVIGVDRLARQMETEDGAYLMTLKAVKNTGLLE
jgi:hypothetical protein